MTSKILGNRICKVTRNKDHNTKSALIDNYTCSNRIAFKQTILFDHPDLTQNFWKYSKKKPVTTACLSNINYDNLPNYNIQGSKYECGILVIIPASWESKQANKQPMLLTMDKDLITTQYAESFTPSSSNNFCLKPFLFTKKEADSFVYASNSKFPTAS